MLLSWPIVLRFEAWLKHNFNDFKFFGVLLLLPLVYLFVFYTGGVKYAFSHSMYLPIVLAGIFFGLKFGFVVGIHSGIFLGCFGPSHLRVLVL